MKAGNGTLRTIAEVRLGHRVATLSSGERGGTVASDVRVEASRWRAVSLVQEDAAHAGVLTMALLRPQEWLSEHGVEVGSSVSLDLPEMGVQGKALVTALEPCPAIEVGAGGLVTGTFRRSRACLSELGVAGERAVLGVTPHHLLWSEDRQEWVAVQELRLGERLRAWEGRLPVVESLAVCAEPEPVYNIEVEGDHCYRVGQQGLLVHNASAPQVCNPAAGSVVYDPVKTVTFMDAGGNAVSGEVGTGVIAYLTPANVGLPRIDLDEPNWWSKLQAVAGGPIQLGHILASSLGGKGKKSWDNLTPLYQRANTPAMRTCEGYLKRLVTECKYCVTVHVQVQGYGQNMSVPAAARPAMPTRVVIDWVTDCGTQQGTFTIDNVTTAAVQDPCRVANLPCRP